MTKLEKFEISIILSALMATSFTSPWNWVVWGVFFLGGLGIGRVLTLVGQYL